MKTKFSRILGVGLTIVVLASMLVISTPASAGTLAFSAEASSPGPLPISSGAQVLDIAVAANGSTVYAALGTKDFSGTIDGVQALVKSTNGGATWTAVNTNSATLTASVKKVAVAPDTADGSFVTIIKNDGAGDVVAISSDGGATWSTAPALSGAPLSIAVSTPIGTTRSLAATTADNNVSVLDLGGIFGGTWVNITATYTSNLTAGAMLAVKFSPNFAGDRTLAVLTEAAGDVVIQLFNTTAHAWNGVVYNGWTPVGTTGGIDVTGGAVASGAVSAASLALAPGFLGADAASRVAYVGISAATTSGLYRVVNTASTALTTGYKIDSVALNTAGDMLAAGAFDSNAVISVTSPATATSSGVVPGTKWPGGPASTNVMVAFTGANVVAGTSGPESAFSMSSDNARTFVDISLVNSTFAPKDFAVSADGSTIYIASINNLVLSVWAKSTAWQRVMAATTSAPTALVRVAPDNGGVVFVAEMGGGNQIYYSNDGGMTTWQPRYSPNTVIDMAVESASIGYILSTGGVSKSIDSGFIWEAPVALPSGVSGQTLTLVSPGNLLVGGNAGDVAYSTNSDVSWTKVSGTIGAGGVVLATADGLASGGNIYAASKNINGNIYRWTIGTSTSWTAMMDTVATGGFTGIGLSGGVLYAVTYDTTAVSGTTTVNHSALYRTLSPTSAAHDSSWSVVNPVLEATTSVLDGFYDLTFTGSPQALEISVGADGNPKLWALSLGSGVVDPRTALESFTDILVKAVPTLSAPADKFEDQINTATGGANNIPFQWAGVTGTPAGTTYTLQIALDSAFTQTVFTLKDQTGTLAIVGPTGVAGTSTSTNYQFFFQADTTYYWRVKIGGPVSSGYSTVQSFKIAPLAPLSLDSPASGAQNISVTPTFVWSPVYGATTYEIVVSDDPTFKIITFSRTTDKPLFAADEQLAYNTVYYWRVRASAPASAVTQFANGIFTTEARPVTPPVSTSSPGVTITQTNTTLTVSVPPSTEAIPAYLLWIIIGIGAILVIALIVLIVRTRRVS